MTRALLQIDNDNTSNEWFTPILDNGEEQLIKEPGLVSHNTDPTALRLVEGGIRRVKSRHTTSSLSEKPWRVPSTLDGALLLRSLKGDT